MAIGTNDLVEKFGSTPTSIDDGSTSSISNLAFSVVGDISQWTNTDDVPRARFILKAQWPTSVSAVINKPVNIYARPMAIEGSNNPVAPGVNRLATLIGKFFVYAATINTNYWFESTDCWLPNMKTAQPYEFYIENQTGQTITAGWALWIVPITDGPKA